MADGATDMFGLRAFWRSARGNSAITYGLLMGMIGVGAITAVNQTGEEVACLMDTSAGEMGRVSGADPVLPLDCGGAVRDFRFFTQTGLEPGERVTSNSAGLEGFEGQVPLSVSGAGNPVLLRNGSEVGSAAVYGVGDRVAVTVTAASGWDEPRTVRVSAGRRSVLFTVRTRVQDTAPSGIALSDRTGLERRQAETVSVTVTHFDGPLAARVSGPGNPGLQVDGGSSADSHSIMPGALLTVTAEAPDAWDATHTVTLQVGSEAAPWRLSTREADRRPDSFSLAEQRHTEPGSWQTASFTAAGFDDTLPVSVDNGAEVRVDGGTWDTSATVAAGQTVEVRLQNSSDSSVSTEREATVTLGVGSDAEAAPFIISNWTVGLSSWSGWGACSASCGGGTQTRTRQCQRSTDTGASVAVDASQCGGATLTESQSCNTGTCYSYAWAAGGWGGCSASCGSGSQSRSVYCQRSDGASVSDSLCSGTRPASSQGCSNYGSCGYSWQTGGWGSCSASCGNGSQSRSVWCRRSDGSTVSDSYCGGGRPSSSTGCSNYGSCGYSWQTGGWGSCQISGGSGGTSATKYRSVWCRRSDGASVSGGYCGGGQPASSQGCSRFTQYRRQEVQQFWACSNCGGPPYNPATPLSWCDRVQADTGWGSTCSGVAGAQRGPYYEGALYIGNCTLGYAGVDRYRYERYCFY